MVLLKPHAIDGETIERIVTVDMGTGRLISQIELLPDDYQATRLLRLPNRGVYALISYTREGYACYSKKSSDTEKKLPSTWTQLIKHETQAKTLVFN